MTTITNDHGGTYIPANPHHKTIDSYTFLRFFLRPPKAIPYTELTFWKSRSHRGDIP